MKILLVSQYFYPEPFIINDLVKTLVEEGHEVVVYTGKPNYPEGEIYSGFSSKGFKKELFNDSVKVYRVPLRPRGKSGAKNLLLNYLSFVFSGTRYLNRIEEKDFDVIFSFGLSPITSVIPAIIYKWKTKKKLFLWVQDLWPESLVATGYVKNTVVLAIVKLMVRWIYSCCDGILIQSKGFHKPISEYVKNSKIIYYPNSIKIPGNIAEIELPEKISTLLDSSFCVVFAGNLGKAQSLATIVDVAEKMNDLINFKIVLVGSGSELEWLKEQKKTRNLNNLAIVGRLPMEVMASVYNKSDALLVTLTDNEIINLTIPSKIQSYLSAGKPIIAALNGEGSKVIQASNCGLVSEAGNSDELEKNIRRLHLMDEFERNKMGASGIKYFNEHFNMVCQTKNLINILQERIITDE
ncbi:glycosyltransferase family 4 protein [Colwellia sp. Bg11-28]|jgi:glycosyltransferase involved in cell wall biosynthesis|uniref:glycosyltransferase family 4 protein n=1 Tax=Colwellia sp. Bg11-28 TaxID=2058305 RepID=UPI000C33C294|nr:glycosyltransferase family 4 protein [Colwellia sp. Bg11-28]PKH87990.1 glycosyltransferase WbuB [Colwellia sp. Bg11-28]